MHNNGKLYIMNMELEIQGQAVNDPKLLAGQYFGMGYGGSITTTEGWPAGVST
jgi:hypothetical protein